MLSPGVEKRGLLRFWLKLTDPGDDAEQGMVNIVYFVAAHSAGLEHGVCPCSEVLASLLFNLNQLWVLRKNLVRQVRLESRDEGVGFAASGFENGVPEVRLAMQKTRTCERQGPFNFETIVVSLSRLDQYGCWFAPDRLHPGLLAKDGKT